LMAEARGYWERFWRQRLSRRRVITGAALGGAGLAAAAVIGCGGEEERPAATATPAPPAATATPAATPTPAVKVVRGGTLNATEAAEPSTLDFYKIASYPNADYASAWYSRLYNYGNTPTGDEFNKLELRPDLAASVEISDDNMTYTFKIRPNAVWHNRPPLNGRKVTAEDVKLAYERFVADDTANPQAKILLATVDNAEAPDDTTVVFNLKGPNAWFTNQVSHDTNMFYMLPVKEIAAGTFDPTKDVVGSGPFIFDRWEPNVIIQMTGNPDYYIDGLDGKPRPYVDNADSFIIRDPAVRIAQFRAGKLDILPILTVDFRALNDLKQTNPDIQSDDWITIGMSHGVSFQSAFPEHPFYDADSPYNDARVRKAVSLGIDRDGLIEVAGEGQGRWNSALSSGFGDKWWIDPKGTGLGDMAKWYKFDVQEAKQLLSAAGYPDGTPSVPYQTSSIVVAGGARKVIHEAVLKMLNDIGVKAVLEVQDHQAKYIIDTWRGKMKGIAGWGTGAKGVVFELLHDTYASTGLQHGGVLDPKVDDFILNKLRQAKEYEERYDIIKEIQLYLADKMYIVPGVNVADIQAAQPWVKNWKINTWFSDWANAYQYPWLDGKPA
ncbi:MAG: ABC transporter substrate-binding protein, partial [Dehalococcoidia bacterium]